MPHFWVTQPDIYLFIVWKVTMLVFAVLPISSSEVSCAYPPFYQLILLGWRKSSAPTRARASRYLTTTDNLLVAALKPSETTSVTRCFPALAYVYLGLASVEIPPAPNDQV